MKKIERGQNIFYKNKEEKNMLEESVLKELEISDFRDLKKDKMIPFMSKLSGMNPDVAKKAIEQIPEFSKVAVEALKEYRDIYEKTITINRESNASCLKTYDIILEELKKILEKDVPFEEKMEVIKRMVEVAQLKDEKETEFREHTERMMNRAGDWAFGILFTLLAVIFGFSWSKNDK
jgi:hypothetical protein